MREIGRGVADVPWSAPGAFPPPQVEAFEQLAVTLGAVLGGDPIHRLRSHLPARLIRRRDFRMHPRPRFTRVEPMPVILNGDRRHGRSGRLFGRSRNRLSRPAASQQTHGSGHSDKTTDKTTHAIFYTHILIPFKKQKLHKSIAQSMCTRPLSIQLKST